MITSFYTAGVGTAQTQKGMDVLANNIANVNTTGFKTQKNAFSDLLYTNMKYEGDSLQVGHGARLAKADTLIDVGAMNTTGRELDFALTVENAFFGVISDGEMKFTRDGNFSLSIQQDGTFLLANSAGEPVVGVNGGTITVDPENMDNIASQIGVFAFDNIDGLERAGESLYSATERSGEAYAIDASSLKQRMLENSNVDYADQMTEVIKTQRAFQFNTRMVQISDEIMQTINNLQ